MSEQYGNLAQTSVATGGYTAGSGTLNVASTAGNFPVSATFRVSIADATTRAVKVILKVTAINSSTQWAVTAEGADANANNGDLVYETLTAGALAQIKVDTVAASALVLLSSQTASAAASLSFIGLMSTLYDTYDITIQNAYVATANAHVDLQFSTNNGASWVTTGYNWGNFGYVVPFATGNPAYASNYVQAASSFPIYADSSGNGQYPGYLGPTTSLRLFNVPGQMPVLLGHGLAYANAPGANVFYSVFCNNGNANNMNAFKVFASTGTFNGTVRLYGVAKQ